MTTETKTREAILEAALIECFDAAIPQAMPWMGAPAEKAEYAAKILPEQLRGLNRLSEHHDKVRADLLAACRDLVTGFSAYHGGQLGSGEMYERVQRAVTAIARAEGRE